MEELEQLLEHVRDTNIQALEDSEATIQRLDQEMAQKTSTLNSMLQELTGRVKACEDEIADEDDDPVRKSGQLAAGLLGTGSIDEGSAQVTSVNMNELQKSAEAATKSMYTA